ncbi:hypothetical protein LEP1GSC059_1350 [Leptospira noguchii serovar Panama str. CZ214]|uniref:Uncharacterized protein n=1 Tax=Leptospira noguchii serovar Panama str. CZ214 TaxID=1001595 RepID=T0GZ41_9LEPT|nr:hypothetical protein LEP1GSC059_1350 [Leptospira noguchii serovar Panama str. CZ214]
MQKGWMRGNSADRSLWIAFYIKTKEDCYIMFPAFNLFTRAENPVWQPDSPKLS